MKPDTKIALNRLAYVVCSTIINGLKNGYVTKVDDGNDDLRMAIKKTLRMYAPNWSAMTKVNVDNVLKTKAQINYVLDKVEEQMNHAKNDPHDPGM